MPRRKHVAHGGFVTRTRRFASVFITETNFGLQCINQNKEKSGATFPKHCTRDSVESTQIKEAIR